MSDLFKEVKKHVELTDVVEKHGVELKKVGNSLRALCPFHNEKTPSFFVNNNQGFICRGCGAKGDVIEFKSKIDNLTPYNAAKALAEQYNVPFEHKSKPLSQKPPSPLDKVARFYTNFVSKGLSVHVAIEYIKNRKISEAVKPFKIGIAPNSFDSLRNYIGLRFPQADIGFWKDCSLLRENQKRPGHFYDSLRSRIIFPVRSPRGEVVGFIGRAYDDAEPKYLIVNNNLKSPRNSWCYGYYESKCAGFSMRRIVVSEGVMDCISYYMLKEFSVSSLGTEISHSLAKLIMKSTREIVLSFDPDKAGFKAIINFMEHGAKYWTESHMVKVVVLPEGKDPDKIRESEGLERLADELGKAQDIFDWVVGYYNELLECDLHSSIKFLKRVDSILDDMSCEILKNATKQYIKAKIGTQGALVQA